MRRPFAHTETQMRPADELILSARFANEKEVMLIKKAAASIGLHMSAFVRLCCLEKADAIASEPIKLESIKLTVASSKKPKRRLRLIKGGRS